MTEQSENKSKNLWITFTVEYKQVKLKQQDSLKMFMVSVSVQQEIANGKTPFEDL